MRGRWGTKALTMVRPQPHPNQRTCATAPVDPGVGCPERCTLGREPAPPAHIIQRADY